MRQRIGRIPNAYPKKVPREMAERRRIMVGSPCVVVYGVNIASERPRVNIKEKKRLTILVDTSAREGKGAPGVSYPADLLTC